MCYSGSPLVALKEQHSTNGHPKLSFPSLSSFISNEKTSAHDIRHPRKMSNKMSPKRKEKERKCQPWARSLADPRSGRPVPLSWPGFFASLPENPGAGWSHPVQTPKRKQFPSGRIPLVIKSLLPPQGIGLRL